MVLAKAQIDLAAVKGRHSLGDVAEAAGMSLRGRGRVRQGVCPFTRRARAALGCWRPRWFIPRLGVVKPRP